MKTISRVITRGKPLDYDCYDAKITRNQFGPEDARIVCYGLVDSMTDEILGKCKKCKAYVENADSPKEG